MSMTPIPLTQLVARTLALGRFSLVTETATQADIEAWLRRELPDPAVMISREHRLGPRDRPDFLVFGCVVIEVKIRGVRREPVLQQLQRYAAHECVIGQVLATNKALDMPATVGGKPLEVVSLGRGWL